MASNLQNAKLDFANLQNADLHSVDLRNANLWQANLQNADLGNADLRNVFLESAYLQNANLAGADFRNAHLREANLTRADISGSQIWTANLFRYTCQTESTRIENVEAKNTQNIEDLLKLLSTLDKHYSNESDDNKITLYFRGEPCNCWELQPSVMRQKRPHDAENKMLNHLMTVHPDSFATGESSFSQLVLGQHYGLPTRLLDVTRNPLVGLFYTTELCSDGECSCNSKCSNNGRLHIFAVPTRLIKPFNSDAVSIVANFAKLSRSQQDLLLSKPFPDHQKESETEISHHMRTRISSDAYQESLTRLCHFIAQEKPYFENRIDYRDFFRVFVVEPQQSFDRLRAQSGAFLISAFHERFEQKEILMWNDGIPVYDHYTVKVPNYRKRHILEELRRLNITRETLIPGLDSSAYAIKKRYMQG